MSRCMIFLLMIAISCEAAFSAEIVVAKPKKAFRDYKNAPAHVKNFYRLQHKNQTFLFAHKQKSQLDDILWRAKGQNEKQLERLEKHGLIKRLSIWDAILRLDDLVDESDPDFTLPNSIHAFQTAEAIRKVLPGIAKRRGLNPDDLDWFILVGLVHDLGKIDALLRKVPQWAVVGDTFPLGCMFSSKNIFCDDFKENPDFNDAACKTEMGIYVPFTGLDNLIMSYGHDEYIFRVLARHGKLPKEALSILRFHSFYPLHNEGAYKYLLAPTDIEQVSWMKEFRPYDLYSKHEEQLSIKDLEPFYKALINKYFPPKPGENALKISWPILPDVSETELEEPHVGDA